MEKQLLVVAGPNGAGKTTFANGYLLRSDARYIGADAIASRLRPGAPEKVSIQAGRLFSAEVRSALEAGKSLLVESTLSGKSFQRPLSLATEIGYRTKIVFISLESPEVCIGRIHERVGRGGHFVPDDDVRRRFLRSHVNFWQLYRLQVDEWSLYFNSQEGFRAVAFGEPDYLRILNDAYFERFLLNVSQEKHGP